MYGLRLLPSEEVEQVGDATLKLKNGREAHVTMHVLEGSKDEIEKQLKTSLEAFFDSIRRFEMTGSHRNQQRGSPSIIRFSMTVSSRYLRLRLADAGLLPT